MIIYVLKLQHGKYYVGKTNNFEKRMHQHETGIGGSFWTKLHKPVEVIRKFEIKSNSFNKEFIYGLEEDKVVKEMMCLYGIDNVRGGSYVREIIDPEIKEFLTREILFAKDLCISCGSNKHFVSECDVVITYECEICKMEFENKAECEYHVKNCDNILIQIEPDEKTNTCCCIIC
jgi:hypothetical protein